MAGVLPVTILAVLAGDNRAPRDTDTDADGVDGEAVEELWFAVWRAFQPGWLSTVFAILLPTESANSWEFVDTFNRERPLYPHELAFCHFHDQLPTMVDLSQFAAAALPSALQRSLSLLYTSRNVHHLRPSTLTQGTSLALLILSGR